MNTYIWWLEGKYKNLFQKASGSFQQFLTSLDVGGLLFQIFFPSSMEHLLPELQLTDQKIQKP